MKSKGCCHTDERRIYRRAQRKRMDELITELRSNYPAGLKHLLKKALSAHVDLLERQGLRK